VLTIRPFGEPATDVVFLIQERAAAAK